MSVGIAIASLTAAAFLAAPIIKLLAWHSRWRRAVNLGGALVLLRDVELNDKLRRELIIGNEEVLRTIREIYPNEPRLTNYRVEVHAKAVNGLGGQLRAERALPVTKLIPIAYVSRTDVAFYIAHEIAQHAVPLMRAGVPNTLHNRPMYRELELEMKRRISHRMLSEGLV